MRGGNRKSCDQHGSVFRPSARAPAISAGIGVLTCTFERSGPVAVLRMTGRLDLISAGRIRSGLHEALAGQPSAIVVDLTDAVVADEASLRVFSAFGRLSAHWGACALLLCTPDPVARELLDRSGVARIAFVRDDCAAALATAAAIPPSSRHCVRISATPYAAATARGVVREVCGAWGLPDLVEDAELVVTELVDNVVLHVGGTVEVVLMLRERYLHVAVHDRNHARPALTLPDPGSGEGGRGLLLVDATAADWGSTEVPDGKVVWADLPRGDRA